MEELEYDAYFVALTKELKKLLEIIPDIGTGERRAFIESYFRTKGLLEQNTKINSMNEKLKTLWDERKGLMRDDEFARTFLFRNRRLVHDAVVKYEEELDDLTKEEES